VGKLINAKVYYGLHFAPGVAEYEDQPGEPYRILIEPEVMKRMDPTMNGVPVFVSHVSKIDFSQKEPDGRVVESFFNTADGMHWAKFLVETEEADRAIANGWTLSNAYLPNFENVEGRWHGVEYSKNVLNGTHEHLALVPNPRYAESKILTPEQFKEYNERKVTELAALKNSAGEKTMIKIFGVSILKNAEEILNHSVELPKTKKTMTIKEIINMMDDMSSEEGMADLGHKVKLHDGTTCNVGELLEKHKQLNDELASTKMKYDELVKGMEPEKKPEGEEEPIEEEKKNEPSPEEKEKLEKEKAEKDKKENSDKAHKTVMEKVEALRKARTPHDRTIEGQVVQTNSDKLARGKKLFGA